MYWKVSDVSHIFRVHRDLVKKWAYEFREYLSNDANPEKGKERKFSAEDLRVFAYIYEYWEEEPDYECIRIGLNRENHLEEKYQEVVYFSSPVFQEVPQDIDETWSHGILLNGAKVNSPLEVARAYKYAAEVLITEALEFNQGHSLDYPIFFTYRHCIELYLKLISDIQEETHSFNRCIIALEKKFGGRVGGIVRKWLEELEMLDSKGTTFRYADNETLKNKEYWVDLYQLRAILIKLSSLCEEVYWDNLKPRKDQ